MWLFCQALQGRSCGSSFARRSVFSIPKSRNDTLLLGCVSYDPAVGTIWEHMKTYMIHHRMIPTFDFILFSNYEQQVRALLDAHIDIAWNGPIAHVLCEQHADIVSLGMRDVDCDFESIVVTKKSSQSTLHGTKLLAGACDSPQAYVVPRHHLQQSISCEIHPMNEDLGKHGDTAIGEIRAMERLVTAKQNEEYDGAILSRMMWDRAVSGTIDSIDSDTLRENYTISNAVELPRFDHCQFDALQSNVEKVEPFYKALHAMDYNNPDHQPVMKLEGIRKSWVKPRQEGYDIVRSAMGFSTSRRAQNFTVRHFSSSNSANETTTSSDNVVPSFLKPGSKVGVIGCGVAGLQVIRSMRARGYQVTAFDKANDIGGLWRENYAGFSLQVGKQFFEMPDLEMTEAEWQELASGQKVQAYIQRFASEFDLNSCTQVNTGIKRVARNSDGSWVFHTDIGKSHTFDYCVVSTGMYSSIPFVPEVARKDTFPGSVIHSSQFLDAEIAKDKRVVVVGGGKSATDCSTMAAKAGATSVTMVERNSHWATPLYIAGLIPFQHVFLSRLGQALVEAKVGVYPGSKSFVASMLRPFMGPIFAIVEELFAFQLGLKGDLRPKSGVVENFYGYAAVRDGTFKSMCDSGKVTVKLGEIETFTNDGVRVNGDHDIAADLVIFATGFAKDYSRLFESDVMDRLDAQNDGLYLYKRILPPTVPGLAFVGSECATIFNCTCSGLQAEWLARTLTGETATRNLTEETMAAEARAFRDFARSWMPLTSSRSALVLLHQLHYYDQLLVDMGENPSRKSNVVAEYLGSYYSGDYNNIVGRGSKVVL